MGLLARLRGRRSAGGEGVEISEQGGLRYLHLGTDTVQSAMRLTEPEELVLSYTRSMLAFLLFMPDPRRVVNIGLGGGSLTKWIYRNLPHVQQVVLELNPRVIACARQYFHLPPDGRRLRVVAADGAEWVSGHADCTDVIVVDGYDGKAQAIELSTSAFYTAAAHCLHDRGLLVVNLWGNDRRFDDYLKRIEGAFEGQVCCIPAAQRGNIIVVAFKSQPLATRWDELREQARLLEERFSVEFPEFVEAMKRLNPHTSRRLII